MDRINEIGDTKKGQEMLGRTAERAYQRAQRTSGADKKRYMRTYNDAYKTGGKSSNKHLGGSREHFDNGRDYEYEKWADEHNGNVTESKTMNKKLIRLTESDLHKIVKESVNRILKETVVHPHICDPRDETYRLEEQGWEHNLWNAIDIDSCMEEGTFSIDVGFFDYTYCVGHEVIPVGSVLECRDIIQAIAKGEKVNNENFMMELENCFYNDEYSEIDSLGFDIISPSGYRAADARGQHSYANLFQ